MIKKLLYPIGIGFALVTAPVFAQAPTAETQPHSQAPTSAHLKTLRELAEGVEQLSPWERQQLREYILRETKRQLTDGSFFKTYQRVVSPHSDLAKSIQHTDVEIENETTLVLNIQFTPTGMANVQPERLKQLPNPQLHCQTSQFFAYTVKLMGLNDMIFRAYAPDGKILAQTHTHWWKHPCLEKETIKP